MKTTEEQVYLENMHLRIENTNLKDGLGAISEKNDKLRKQYNHSQDLLDRTHKQYSLQKDVNGFFRKFYARNVI